jgi:hypothetical protein
VRTLNSTAVVETSSWALSLVKLFQVSIETTTRTILQASKLLPSTIKRQIIVLRCYHFYFILLNDFLEVLNSW